MGKKALPLCLLALLPSSAVAQSDDFGLDFSLEAQKKINKQWSIGLEGELRTRDNTKTVDRWSVGLGVDYKVLKWLKASAGYNLLYDNNQNISYYEAADDAVLDGDAEIGDPKKCAKYWIARQSCRFVNVGNIPIVLSIPSASAGVIWIRLTTARRKPIPARVRTCFVAVCS